MRFCTQDEEAGVELLVVAPADGVTLECEDPVATHEEFRCNSSVLAGTFMDTTIDFSDGLGPDGFHIAG